MSNYPVWWDATITLYNKHTDNVTKIVSWTKTVIPNCFWKNVGNKVMVGNVILDTSSIICRIPIQSNFMEYGEWLALPNDIRKDYFTLKQGDIVIHGACDDEINEYQSGSRSTDLIAKYKSLGSCMEIKEIAINTMTGMLNPYYYIKGI